MIAIMRLKSGMYMRSSGLRRIRRNLLVMQTIPDYGGCGQSIAEGSERVSGFAAR